MCVVFFIICCCKLFAKYWIVETLSLNRFFFKKHKYNIYVYDMFNVVIRNNGQFD